MKLQAAGRRWAFLAVLSTESLREICRSPSFAPDRVRGKQLAQGPLFRGVFKMRVEGIGKMHAPGRRDHEKI
jgi:hypothetical protein